ncbi:hypothetical protein NNO95_03900 [Acinetobacter baumannii]|uniref:hypothetical protein n=1 Tax=Acinetobacter baumannii TaxID=470 RepID=UPI0020CB7D91|nr:hypothetical protein [Acinetobacter baumannii]MCQ1053521.1 hypothetical protein [Acinetobacter baumannii]
MDYVCSLDWGIIKDILGLLISAGIPSLVAWKIFRGWNNQKGSEVIANEAKNILVTIEKIEILQGDIRFWLGLKSEINENKLQEFSKLKDSLENSILLLNHAIDDHDFNFYLNEILEQLKNADRSLTGFESDFLEIKDLQFTRTNSYQVLKKQLLDYAVYKKKVNYKNS